MVCPICKDFQTSTWPPPIAQAYEDARRSGCLGCGMILDAIEAFEPGWLLQYRGECTISLNPTTGFTLAVTTTAERQPVGVQFQIFQSRGMTFPICNRSVGFLEAVIQPCQMASLRTITMYSETNDVLSSPPFSFPPRSLFSPHIFRGEPLLISHHHR